FGQGPRRGVHPVGDRTGKAEEFGSQPRDMNGISITGDLGVTLRDLRAEVPQRSGLSRLLGQLWARASLRQVRQMTFRGKIGRRPLPDQLPATADLQCQLELGAAAMTRGIDGTGPCAE